MASVRAKSSRLKPPPQKEASRDSVPGIASLHPGYGFAGACTGFARRPGHSMNPTVIAISNQQ